ncbi:MAG TPA: S8 family serine peptidase [Candidatus Saccharimonadales bacterium]|nr:S8 family serine peptidase [Candidatus Saccharimonadales bacterium]
MSQKILLITLGIVTILGLFYIIISSTQPTDLSSPSSPVSPTLIHKQGNMMPPVKDHSVDGQIIVKFKPQYSQIQIAYDLKKYQASIKSTIEGINQTIVQVPKGREEEITQKLKNDPYVEQTQRDYTTHAFVIPNDPQFAMQYAFNNTGQAVLGHNGKAKADIEAESAWNTTEGNGVKVAVLDTGVNLNQPDLSGKVVLQKSFLPNVTSVEDGNGHGTHTAGIIAADTNNGIGVSGTCPGCQLLIGKVLDDSGSGTTSEATAGITWAADNGAKVISMSLGTTEANTASMYNQAVSYAMSKGAIVVAAAGNDGNSQLNYPAAATGVVSVAATTNNDAKASYSNFGNWVQIAAPGDNILSTGPTHSFQIAPFGYSISSPYYYLSGTSMATPIVAGVAALISTTSFGTSPQAIANRLYATADKIGGTGTDWVHGRLNAAAAVGQKAATPTATPTPTPKNSLITPTLFCVGGSAQPPCATIPPSGAPSAVPSGGGGGSNPSAAPSSAVSPGVSGNPSVSGSPSVSPIAGGGGTGVGLPCPNQNSTSSFAVADGGTSISAHGHHSKGHHHKGGFLSGFFKFLLQLILKLLQLIGINPCGGSGGTPTISPTPSGSPSSAPSQTVSAPPVSGGVTQPTATPKPVAGQPTAPAPTSGTTSSCVTSDPQGRCPSSGYYTDPQIVGGTNPWVNQNVWGAGGTNYQQTLHANSAGDWYITASVNNASGSVLTFPNTGWSMPTKTIDSYSTITSSWNVTIPTDNKTTAGWAAYDLWFNDWADEVMIQTDIVANSNYDCTSAGSTTINGQAWHFCDFGSERVLKPGTDDSHLRNETSGSVDVKALLQWLEQNGHLPKNSVWTAGSFGFEVTNTSGTTQTFKVNGFTWTSQ